MAGIEQWQPFWVVDVTAQRAPLEELLHGARCFQTVAALGQRQINYSHVLAREVSRVSRSHQVYNRKPSLMTLPQVYHGERVPT